MSIQITSRPINLFFSGHALEQMAKRGLRKRDVEFVVAKGTCYHRAGGRWYVLLEKNLSRELARTGRYNKLVGTSVLLCRHQDLVITAYRVPNLIHILRKSKYDNQVFSKSR